MTNLHINEIGSGLYTILGAGGSIGTELFTILSEKGKSVRLVSRQGRPVAGAAEVMAADISDPLQARRAISGSSIVFLCVGLAYDFRIWKETWPKIIQNVMDACIEAGIPLMFFDNVYMYGLVDGPMTEDTPYNPVSKKGELRAGIADKIMSSVRKGELMASIVRSADFYGPAADRTGIPNFAVINKLAKGQKALVLGRDDMPHSYTFVPDAVKAMYLLAEDPSSFNQIWHLPTANPAPNGKEYVQMVAAALKVKPRYMKLNGLMIRLAGLFDRTTYELHEMLYQVNHPYIFDSSKFERHYNFKPTSYEEGIDLAIKDLIVAGK